MAFIGISIFSITVLIIKTGLMEATLNITLFEELLSSIILVLRKLTKIVGLFECNVHKHNNRIM